MASGSVTVGVAARRGDLQQLQQLIRDGYDIDVKDTRGWRATHEAAQGNHVECLKFLLQQDVVEVDWQSFEGVTALLVACQQGHVECCRLLLEHGADANLPDAYQTYPMFMAVCAKCLECVKLLLEHGANVNSCSQSGTSPLHQAVSGGLVDMTRHLVDNGANIDALEECEITPVFAAAQFGKEECLDILLEKAKSAGCLAVVNRCAEDGGSPLYLAAQEGHAGCLKALLAAGADANLMTEAPKALPLQAAIQFERTQCIECLFPVTSASALRECDASLFDFAFQHDDPRYTQLLVSLGADVSQLHALDDSDVFVPRVLDYSEHRVLYSSEVPPLTWLAVMDYGEQHAAVLLKAGARPNPSSALEIPALLAALNNCRLPLIQLLIQHGASVDHYNPGVCGNLTLITCLFFWRGLHLMLHCGAEPDSLFATRTEPSSSNQQASADGDDSNNTEPSRPSTPPPLDLYTVLMSARYAMSRRRVSVSQVLALLLFFTANVCLDPRLEAVVDSKQAWQQIQRLAESPRSLTHLCRYVIRRSLGPKELHSMKNIRSLALPQPILDFLLYKELNDLVMT